MGSYLAMNGYDCGCKSYSHIIIEVIRNLDLQFKDPKFPNYFIPQERNKDGVGIGNWKITRKGLAMVMDSLKEMMLSEKALTMLILDEYDYQLSKLSTKIERDDFIKNHLPEAKRDVEECLFFIINIMTMSIMDERRTIKLTWV